MKIDSEDLDFVERWAQNGIYEYATGDTKRKDLQELEEICDKLRELINDED